MMTDNRIRHAASMTLQLLLQGSPRPPKYLKPTRHHDLRSPTRQQIMEHGMYVAQQIDLFVSQQRREKAMRWLGFLQGLAWVASGGRVSIEDLGRLNMPEEG